MVPKGWQRKTVGELCDFVNGNGFKSAEWVDSGWPIIRIQNLNGSDNFNYYDGDINDKWIVNPGDILFAWAGTKGVSFGAKRWEGPIGLLNQHIFKVIAKVQVDSTWLYLAMLRVTERVENMAHGFKSTLLHVQKSDITEQILNVPPSDEQKKIAQILSTWDKAITTTEKLLANSQQQKKALMQQLLTGKVRLLDGNGVRFKGEWKPLGLSKIAEVVMGSSPKSEAYNEIGSGLPLIQGNADIKNRFSEPRVYTSEITKECEPNDILLSVRAPVGAVALSRHKACIGRGIAAIRANKNYSQSFIYQWLLWFEPQWVSLSQGSTFESVNSDDIKSLKVLIPEYEEQYKIADALSKVDQEISALQQQLAALKNETTALMQQLLMGKRRVSVSN